MLTCVVSSAEEGARVREVLRRSLTVSSTALRSAKWNGVILLNGARVHTDVRVHAGDVLSIDFPQNRPEYIPQPYDLPLSIPFEDEHLLVVDKPAPLASQSSLNHPDDSLENAVYAYLGCPENYVYRPVNRLDKGTSGLMVIAKSGHVQHLLQVMLHGPNFIRRYLALTEGIPEPCEGVLDFPIGKAPGATIRRQVTSDGQPARTRYRVIEAWENAGLALVSLELETGRTHQIRVHLSHIGCPVLGDFLYGTERPDLLPGRFALHSAELILHHPMTGQLLHLHSAPAFDHLLPRG